MTKIAILPVRQRIGEFYLGVLSATELLKIGFVRQRTLGDPDGIQRKESTLRISEIARYLSDPDATFPTSIILSCKRTDVKLEDNYIVYDDEKIGFAEIVDGQHRFRGMRNAPGKMLENFDVPVVFMLNLDGYQKAYVFSTINSKQRPVPKSLIYDLFDLAEKRSPSKTCHEVARALNSEEGGPFFQGLKMLGTKVAPSEYLTQGSFVSELIRRISKHPQQDEIDIKNDKTLVDDESLPFRYYFIKNQDASIVKILSNFFSGVRTLFPDEWNYPTADLFILRKAVGYKALLLVFDELWPKARENDTASFTFFADETTMIKERLNGRQLSVRDMGTSGGDARLLANVLLGRPNEVEDTPTPQDTASD